MACLPVSPAQSGCRFTHAVLQGNEIFPSTFHFLCPLRHTRRVLWEASLSPSYHSQAISLISVHKFTVLRQIYKQHPSRPKDLMLMPSRALHLPWLPPRPLCMSFLLLCSYSSATLWNPQSLLPQGCHSSSHPVSATRNIVCPLTCFCLLICGLIRKVSLDSPTYTRTLPGCSPP